MWSPWSVVAVGGYDPWSASRSLRVDRRGHRPEDSAGRHRSGDVPLARSRWLRKARWRLSRNLRVGDSSATAGFWSPRVTRRTGYVVTVVCGCGGWLRPPVGFAVASGRASWPPPQDVAGRHRSGDVPLARSRWLRKARWRLSRNLRVGDSSATAGFWSPPVTRQTGYVVTAVCGCGGWLRPLVGLAATSGRPVVATAPKPRRNRTQHLSNIRTNRGTLWYGSTQAAHHPHPVPDRG
jgi:hypothetical protein